MIIFYKKKTTTINNNSNTKNNKNINNNNNKSKSLNNKNIKSNSTPSSPNSYSLQQQQQQQLNKSKSLNNHNYNTNNNTKITSTTSTATVNIYKENDFIKEPAPKHVVEFLKYAKDTILPYQIKKRTVSFLEDNGDLMNQFQSIHEDYRNEYVPLMDVYREIVELFKDYPELIAAYINTLPKDLQYEIRYSETYNQSCINNFINAAKVYSTRRQYQL